jgi:hypothetical protein
MLYPDAWKGTLPPELKQVAESGGRLQLNLAADLSLEFLAHLVFPVWLHTPNLRLLDAACGTGETVALQAVRYPHTAIAAQEDEQDALELAKNYITELGLNSVTFEPEQAATYHIVQASRPLNQLPDAKAFLQQLRSQLASPGVVSISADAVFGGPRFEALQVSAERLRMAESSEAELQTAIGEILAVLDAPAQPGLWNIPDLAQLTAEAGLRIAALIHPDNYQPVRFIESPALHKLTTGLPIVEQAWLTEVMLGQSLRHRLVLVPAEVDAVMPKMGDAEAAQYIPHPSPYAKVEQTEGGRYQFSLNRQHLLLHPAISTEAIEAPQEMVRVFQAVNGMATFEQIYRRFMPMSWDVFWHFMNLMAENGLITLHREATGHGIV